MGLGLYKSGEGYWTRVLTAIAIGLITVGFVVWMRKHLFPSLIGPVLGKTDAQLAPALRWTTIGVCVAMAVGTWLLINWPRFTDFLIATEAEMRKSEWPALKSVAVSTGIVVLGIALIGAFLFGADQGFVSLFRLVGIL